MNRAKLLTFAESVNRLLSDGTGADVYSRLRYQDKITFATAAQWYAAGLQSVIMPATFEAGLMVSDAQHAIEGEPMPWPAFEIQVRSGCLVNASEVFSVLVAEPPPWIEYVKLHPTLGRPKVFVCYQERSGITTTNWFPSLRAMFDAEMQDSGDEHPWRANEHDYEKAARGSVEKERRVWTMVARLVCGVILSVNQHRESEPHSFKRPHKVKGGATAQSTWQLGKPLALDVRHSVKEYVSGDAPRDPKVTTLVRGHWRNQVHGPGNANRRLQWIHPFYRGHGPMILRPTRIGP